MSSAVRCDISELAAFICSIASSARHFSPSAPNANRGAKTPKANVVTNNGGRHITLSSRQLSRIAQSITQKNSSFFRKKALEHSQALKNEKTINREGCRR